MSIETDTPIVPLVIAEAVVEECERLLGVEIPFVHVGDLAARAERIYKSSESFRRRVQRPGNLGRDTVYSFMRHWLTAIIDPQLGRRVPDWFRMGYDEDKRGRY